MSTPLYTNPSAYTVLHIIVWCSHMFLCRLITVEEECHAIEKHPDSMKSWLCVKQESYKVNYTCGIWAPAGEKKEWSVTLWHNFHTIGLCET